MQQQPPMDMNTQPFGNLGDNGGFQDMTMEFGALDGGDVLDNFDFDSFLNNGEDGGGFNFDGLQFDGLEAGGDSMGQ